MYVYNVSHNLRVVYTYTREANPMLLYMHVATYI